MGLKDFFKRLFSKRNQPLLGTAQQQNMEPKGINLQKEIIEKMESGWNEKEKARFIQTKLGEIMNFDPKLNLYEIPDPEYQEIYQKEFDVENVTDTYVTCNSLGKMTVELLKRAGIDATLDNRFHHAYVMANLDGEDFRIDPTATNPAENNQDLFKIKEKIMPSGEYYQYLTFVPVRFLGNNPDKFIPLMHKGQDVDMQRYLQELKQIDENIHYIKEGSEYTNIYFSILKQELDQVNIDTITSQDENIVSAREILGLKENATREDIFKAKFHFILGTLQFQNMGIHEATQYAKYSFDQLLDKKDSCYMCKSPYNNEEYPKSRIGGCNIYTQKENEFDFKNVFWLKTDDMYEYYILDPQNKEKPIQETTKEDLQKLLGTEGNYKLYDQKSSIPNVTLKPETENPEKEI